MKHKLGVTIILLGCVSLANAAPLSKIQQKCLTRLQQETSFILTNIEAVNQEYEQKLKDKKLYDFTSGDYSTQVFLDSSIRKYHIDLKGRVSAVPEQYRSAIVKSGNNPACMASKIQQDGIGIIHNFEITWQKTIEKANKNRKFFQSIDNFQ